jgi:hypothetical protein
VALQTEASFLRQFDAAEGAFSVHRPSQVRRLPLQLPRNVRVARALFRQQLPLIHARPACQGRGPLRAPFFAYCHSQPDPAPRPCPLQDLEDSFFAVPGKSMATRVEPGRARASSGLIAVPKPLFRASTDLSRGGVALGAWLAAARHVNQADVPRFGLDIDATCKSREGSGHSFDVQSLSIACESEGVLACSPGLTGGDGFHATPRTADMVMPASPGRTVGTPRPTSRPPSSSRSRGAALGTGGGRGNAADSAASSFSGAHTMLSPGATAAATACDSALVAVRSDALAELHDALAGAAEARSEARACRWRLLVTAALGRRRVADFERWAAGASAGGMRGQPNVSLRRACDWVVERVRRAAEGARSAAAEAAELEQYYEASLRAAAMQLTSQLPDAALLLARATRDAEVCTERGSGGGGASWLWHKRGIGRGDLGKAGTRATGGAARPATPMSAPAGGSFLSSPVGSSRPASRPVSACATWRPGSATSRSIPAASAAPPISGTSAPAVATYLNENLLLLGSAPAAGPGAGGGDLCLCAPSALANGLTPSPPAAGAPRRPASSRLHSEKNPAFKLAPNERPVLSSCSGQDGAASVEAACTSAGEAPTSIASTSGEQGAINKRLPRAAARVKLGLAAGAALRQTQMQMPELSTLHRGTRPTSARGA